MEVRDITLDQLDGELDRLDEAAQITDGHMRDAGALFRLRVDLDDLPADPYSDEYRAWQLRLYERIAGRPYGLLNEETLFDAALALADPFPWSARNPRTVGEHLMAHGHIIREMGLPASARVLEMGSGYGTLAVNLAAMAYKLTCVDVSRSLLDLVAARTKSAHFPVELVCGDMAVAPFDGRFDRSHHPGFDGIVFYESFHHCLDHAVLMSKLGSLLAPGGRVVFGGEPIVPTTTLEVPYPWGLRLDGLSVRAIRRFGWLELGFTADYFTGLLDRTGWAYGVRPLGDVGLATVWFVAPAASIP